MAGAISKPPQDDEGENRSPKKPGSVWFFLSFMGKRRKRRSSNDKALQRVILLLLETIEAYAYPSDALNYARFSSHIRDIAETFSTDMPDDDVLIAAHRACTTLKLHFRRTGQFLATQMNEYQKIVSMFTETVASLSASGEHSVACLKDIEKQVDSATLGEDIHSHRLRLGPVLEAIHKEIERQETVSANVRHFIETNIEQDKRAETRGAADCSQGPDCELTHDPVSGFPAHKLGESALVEALRSGDSYYVVVVVARGADVIYSRLGPEVGDSALYYFAEHMRSFFGGDSSIFRWHGTSFVVLLKRSLTLTQVRTELSSIAYIQLDDPIRVGTRSLWLPMSISWEVIAATQPYYSLALEIDEFIAKQASYS